MRRLVALFLAVCMGLCFSTVAIAEDIHLKTLDEIIMDWIDSEYQGEANTSKIIALFDESNQNIGHLISFEKGGSPAGYIVLSHKESDNPIIEFALDGESVYDYLEEQFADNKANIISECLKKTSDNTISSYSIVSDVMYTDFINYSLVIESSNEVLLFNQYKQIQIIHTENDNMNRLLSTSSSDKVYYDEPDDNTVYRKYYIPGSDSDGLVLTKMPDFVFGAGNCGPTSLTNTVKLYAENALNNHRALPSMKTNLNDDDTYRRLVTLSGFSNGNAVGMDKLCEALISFTSERGYVCSIDDYSYDYWTDFKRDIENDKPILLYTRVNGAHSQVVVGYRDYYCGTGIYLKIFSGWTSYATYVKFKASSFIDFNGYCVAIDIKK